MNKATGPAGSAPATRRERGNGILLLIGVGLLIMLVALAVQRIVGPSPDRAIVHTNPRTAGDGPDFVGSRSCAACHAEQYRDWMDSHHQKAMQPATRDSVLGDFDNVRVAEGDGATFLRDGDDFLIRTRGPDGEQRDYPVRYTFGVEPLQQYLIALPGGRLQAFTTAWDSRPHEEGGQRWFALYPQSDGELTSASHWSAIDQNWNAYCAHCHSTGLRKQYDPTSGDYATEFAEVSVGCETCHGPGSAHLDWARQADPDSRSGRPYGLTVDFGADPRGHWHYDVDSGKVTGRGPAAGDREVETCARCHALGTPLHEQPAHGQTVNDNFRVALLDPELYFPDGQIKAEVFEYGSFLQSRMFDAGVTCSNCHDPHSARPRIEGNSLCTQCHQAERYDTPSHFHHPVDSPGARCVDCHMPSRTYMRIDPRRDHSIRVPRPDLSAKLGTPNACNQCHQDENADWAARHIRAWGGGARGFQTYAEAFHGAFQGAPDAFQTLAALINNPDQPAIARATAVTRLAEAGGGGDALFRRAAMDTSSLVRRAAALHPAAALGLLDDPVRSVRIAAAETLAPLAASAPPALADTLASATGEYIEAQELSADRPEAHLGLARMHVRRGDPDAARLALETALRLDPAFVPAAINLADLHRGRGADQRAGDVLRQALRHAPNTPALHYALGLLAVRHSDRTQALDELAAATRLAPDNVQYAYVYALALDQAGDTDAAIQVLRTALQRHPWHRPSITTLVEWYRRQGRDDEAARYEQRLRSPGTIPAG